MSTLELVQARGSDVDEVAVSNVRSTEESVFSVEVCEPSRSGFAARGVTADAADVGGVTRVAVT